MPTFVIAGTADSVIPYEQSRELAAALGAELKTVDGADHNDWRLFADPPLLDAIAQFLDGAVDED